MSWTTWMACFITMQKKEIWGKLRQHTGRALNGFQATKLSITFEIWRQNRKKRVSTITQWRPQISVYIASQNHEEITTVLRKIILKKWRAGSQGKFDKFKLAYVLLYENDSFHLLVLVNQNIGTSILKRVIFDGLDLWYERNISRKLQKILSIFLFSQWVKNEAFNE